MRGRLQLVLKKAGDHVFHCLFQFAMAYVFTDANQSRDGSFRT